MVMCVECYFVTAAIGAFIGLLAALATRRTLRGTLMYVGVGVVGAVSLAWFLAPLTGNTTSQHINTPEVVGALFGAFVTLAFFEAFRPRGW